MKYLYNYNTIILMSNTRRICVKSHVCSKVKYIFIYIKSMFFNKINFSFSVVITPRVIILKFKFFYRILII